MSNVNLIHRKNTKGVTAVTAQVRITVSGEYHTESKTFSAGTDQQNERNAKQWAKRRVSELQVNGLPKEEKPVTLAELAHSYLTDYADNVRMGNSKRQSLVRISDYAICKKPVHKLEAGDYIKHAKGRMLEGVKPQTVNDDLVWLGVLLKFGRAAHGCKPDMDELDAAKSFMKSNGMTASGKRRERLPTAEEFRKLVGYYSKNPYRGEMLQIILFSMTSARRISETTRIKFSDNDDEHRTGLVRDLKDPRNKAGNNHRFNYTPEAWAIVEARKAASTGNIIFDHCPRAASINFTRACKLLEIENLHLHDLRHWATSWLFWQGLSIQQVAEVTLHQSWGTLKGYTHMGRAEQKEIEAIHKELICLIQTL